MCHFRFSKKRGKTDPTGEGKCVEEKSNGYFFFFFFSIIPCVFYPTNILTSSKDRLLLCTRTHHVFFFFEENRGKILDDLSRLGREIVLWCLKEGGNRKKNFFYKMNLSLSCLVTF